MIDPESASLLCRLYPIDKLENASGRRRRKGAAATADTHEHRQQALSGAGPGAENLPNSTDNPPLPPLLQSMIEAQQDTARPLAYLPKRTEELPE